MYKTLAQRETTHSCGSLVQGALSDPDLAAAILPSLPPSFLPWVLGAKLDKLQSLGDLTTTPESNSNCFPSLLDVNGQEPNLGIV